MLVGHAHLIRSDASCIEPLLDLLEKEGIECRGNADTYLREYRQFGVEEARELRERASSRALGERRVFIIATPSITAEAQNALLKTLEEPPAGALFFFIVPAPEVLLPTLRSRTQILSLSYKIEKNDERLDAKKFLAAPVVKRLDMLKPLLEKGDDDKRDTGAILAFLSSLEKEMAEQPESLRALYRARKYIGDRGALVKPLLEQMALLV
jgi:DNA polymerase III delta prime subunit